MLYEATSVAKERFNLPTRVENDADQNVPEKYSRESRVWRVDLNDHVESYHRPRILCIPPLARSQENPSRFRFWREVRSERQNTSHRRTDSSLQDRDDPGEGRG